MHGDFTGFSFDGIHSSSLNIIRVSGGDRYEDSILPEIEDATLIIPGLDGELFYNSRYTHRTFSLEIAYDCMTETNFRQMVKLFSTKKPCKLVFDERPYKVYLAKLASPIQLSYICFDRPKTTVGETVSNAGVRVVSRENNNIIREDITPYVVDHDKVERIYKGEGTIELVATYPFAHSYFKTLEEYIAAGYSNIEEWQESSGILSQELYNELGIDVVSPTTQLGYNYKIPVYNAGDLDAPYRLYIPYSGGLYDKGALTISNGNYIYINSDDNILAIKPFTSRLDNNNQESGVFINTKTHLIEGVRQGEKGTLITTGEIYNNYIEAGDFGVIKHLDYDLYSDRLKQAVYINCDQGNKAQIFYDYLYY